MDEDDAADYNAEVTEQSVLLASVVDIWGDLIDSNAAVFGPLFAAQILPGIQQILYDDRRAGGDVPLTAALSALCSYIGRAPDRNVLLHIDTARQYFIACFQRGFSDDLRQTSCFGFGTIAQALQRHVLATGQGSPQDYAGFVSESTTALVQVLSEGSALPPAVAANAMASIVRIFDSFSSVIPEPLLMQLFGVFVPHLPAKGDKVEAVFVHDTLVRWATVPGHPVMSPPMLRIPIMKAILRSKNLSPECSTVLLALRDA